MEVQNFSWMQNFSPPYFRLSVLVSIIDKMLQFPVCYAVIID